MYFFVLFFSSAVTVLTYDLLFVNILIKIKQKTGSPVVSLTLSLQDVLYTSCVSCVLCQQMVLRDNLPGSQHHPLICSFRPPPAPPLALTRSCTPARVQHACSAVSCACCKEFAPTKCLICLRHLPNQLSLSLATIPLIAIHSNY